MCCAPPGGPWPGNAGPGRDEVTIRPATPDDADPLAALAARTWADAFADSLEDPGDAEAELADGRSPDRFRQVLRDPEREILVATGADGTLLGYVEAGPVDIPEADAGPDDRALRRLYVETALHGRGIGRQLLGAALTRAPLAQAPQVFLQVWERNPRAIALYERAGFAVITTTCFTIGDSAPMEDLVMVRAGVGAGDGPGDGVS